MAVVDAQLRFEEVILRGSGGHCRVVPGESGVCCSASQVCPSLCCSCGSFAEALGKESIGYNNTMETRCGRFDRVYRCIDVCYQVM